MGCRVLTGDEGLLWGGCWRWIGQWWLTRAMWVVLAPSSLAASHGIGATPWGQGGFQLWHSQPCKQSAINHSEGSDVPPALPTNAQRKSWVFCRCAAFLGPLFLLIFTEWVWPVGWSLRDGVLFVVWRKRADADGSLGFLLPFYYTWFSKPRYLRICVAPACPKHLWAAVVTTSG